MDDETVSSPVPAVTSGQSTPQLHQDFIPLKNLQISDLPQGWKSQKALDVIGHVAQRVVMVYIPRMSSERPTSIFSGHPHFGGTGFAYYVDQNIVKVRTNLHVIYNAEEAGMATVQFSLHVPGKRHVRVIRLPATSHHFHNNLGEDYASFTCYPNSRLRKYLGVFSDVPVLWDASFFLGRADSGSEDSAADVEDMEVDRAPPAPCCQGLRRRQEEGGGLCGGRQVTLQNYPGDIMQWENHSGEALLDEHRPQHPGQAGLSDSLVVEYDKPESLEASRLSEGDQGMESNSDSEREEVDFVYNVDRSSLASPKHCRRPTLENGDYVAILSHPQGKEKSFSIGLAGLYDQETLKTQRSNFRNMQRQSKARDHSHAGHPAIHLINDRFRLCKNRIYHTQSTFGCSGAPVLLFKRSLQRIKVPVVDYSQHSGTCFFKNGEKLGFATCFTPPVFAPSVPVYEDLQQCYSVIRKHEQMLRHKGKLHCQKFEQPDCAAESTHIVNSDSVHGVLSYCYGTEKGAIIKKKIFPREYTPAPGVPPIPSFQQKVNLSSHSLLPEQLQAKLSMLPGEQSSQGGNENDVPPQESEFSSNKTSPLKKCSANVCGVKTFKDLLSFEDMSVRANLEILEIERPFGNNNAGHRHTLGKHSRGSKASKSNRPCDYSLESGFAYRIHRKKSRSISCPIEFVKEKVTQKLQALKRKVEGKPDTQAPNPPQLKPKFKLSARFKPEHGRIPEHKSPTRDADSKAKPLTTSTAELNVLDTSCTSSNNSQVSAFSPVKRSLSKFSPGKIPSPDTGDLKGSDKATGADACASRCRWSVSPDRKRQGASLEHQDMESVYAYLTSLESTRERVAHCRTSANLSQDMYARNLTSQFTQCSSEPSVLPDLAFTTFSNFSQKVDNFSEKQKHLEERRRQRETTMCFPFSDTNWKFPSLSLSGHETEGDNLDDNVVTVSSEKHQSAFENAPELKTSFLSTASNKLPSRLSSVSGGGRHEDRDEWDRSLECDSFSDLTSDFADDEAENQLSDDDEVFEEEKAEDEAKVFGEEKAEDEDEVFEEEKAEDEVFEEEKAEDEDEVFKEKKAEDENGTLPDPDLEEIWNTLHSSEENIASVIPSVTNVPSISSSVISSATCVPSVSSSEISSSSSLHTANVSSMSSENEMLKTSSSPVKTRRTNDEASLATDQPHTSPESKRDWQRLSVSTDSTSPGSLMKHLQHRQSVSHSSALPLADVEKENDKDKEQSSASETEASGQPRPDHHSKRQSLPLMENDVDDPECQQPLCKLGYTDANTEMSEVPPDIYQQDHTSEIPSLPETCHNNQMSTHSVDALLAGKEAEQCEVSKHISSSEHSSQETLSREQPSEKSSWKTFSNKIQQAASDERIPQKSGPLHADLVDTFHPPLKLTFPRSAYSLHDLKVLEYARKQMSGEGSSEKWTWPGTQESPEQDPAKKKSMLGLQEMADRILRLETPKIDTLQGYTNRYKQLYDIQKYLTEIESNLHVPKSDPFSSLSSSQPYTSSLQNPAPLPLSYEHAQPSQRYDLNPVHTEWPNAKEAKLKVHSVMQQRTEKSVEQRNRVVPPIFNHGNAAATQKYAFDIGCLPYGQSVPSREGQDSLNRAFAFNKEAGCRTVVGHTRLSNRPAYLNPGPKAAGPMIHPNYKPLPCDLLCPEVPDLPADPAVYDRLSKAGPNGLYFARDPRLYALKDSARIRSGALRAESHGHVLNHQQQWGMPDPKPLQGLYSRVLEADNSHKVVRSELPPVGPERVKILPGCRRMPYTAAFQQQDTGAEHSGNFSSDMTSCKSSSGSLGTIGSGSRGLAEESPQLCGNDARILHNEKQSREKMLMAMKALRERGLHSKDLDRRRTYPEHPTWWNITGGEYHQAMRSCPPNMTFANLSSYRAYLAQQACQRVKPYLHSGPKAACQEGPVNSSDPFPHYFYSWNPLTAKNERVHYRHESAKFDSSLRSSPVVMSSTDNSSFHSSPELSQDPNAVAESTLKSPSKAEESNVHKRWERSLGLTESHNLWESSLGLTESLKPWKSSLESTESVLPFTSSSSVHFTPLKTKADVRCKQNEVVDASCKCRSKANTVLFPTIKPEEDASTTVPSLSEAFERFLSSDVGCMNDDYQSAAECCWKGQECCCRNSMQKLGQFPNSVHDSEQARSLLEPLWVDTEDGVSDQPGSSCCRNFPAYGACCHAPLLKPAAGGEDSAVWKNGQVAQSALSIAFDRFLNMSAEDGSEFPASETFKSDPPHNSDISSDRSESAESCEELQETRVYNLNDVVRVVLEMGVIHPENDHCQQDALESPVDNLGCETRKPFCRTPDHSVYMCSSTGTDDCCLNSKSQERIPLSSKSKKSHRSTLKKRCAVPGLVCESSSKTPKSHSQKQKGTPFYANIEKEQSSCTNNCSDALRSRSRERHPRPKVTCKVKSRSGDETTTLSSQPSSGKSSSALHRSSSGSGGLPSRKRGAERASRKKSALSSPGLNTRPGQTCLPEQRKPPTPRSASRNVAVDGFQAAGCDCQHFESRQACCPKVAMPFVLPWSSGALFPFCGPLHCVHSQNSPLGYFPPFLPPQQCPHGCLCKHVSARHHTVNPNVHAVPNSGWPELSQNWILPDQHLLSSELSSPEVDNSPVESEENDFCHQHACVATVDAVDVSLVPTLQDLGIVQVLLSDEQEEAKTAHKTSSAAADSQEHSSGTTSRHGIYTKNSKTKRSRTANRYTKKGKEGVQLRRPKSVCSTPQLAEDTESREAATSDNSASSFSKRKRSKARILKCRGQLTNESGSEKSDREICYVTVPVDIRIRLEKAAKWISTQLFVCPKVHLLTPRDARTFSIQQNLHLTHQILTLND